jgi:hypothetical protein
MGILKLKPKRGKIDLKKTIAQNIEYYCKTTELDQIVCERKDLPFNKDIAETWEKHARTYFVIKKNMEYDLISGTLLEPWLKEQQLELPEQSAKAKKCINHYLAKIGY